MSLSTYADLKAAIAGWNMGRPDLPSAELVTLAEARLNRDVKVRTAEADTPLAGVSGSRFIPLPTGFLEPIAMFVTLDGQGRSELRFAPAAMETDPAAGLPQWWSIDGANVAFERPCDQAYAFTLRSLQQLMALSDASPTNWLLADAPDLYLAACNVEAALWLEDDEQALRWQARYDDALKAVNHQAHRSRAKATLSVDPALQQTCMGNRWTGYDINSDR
jgi:hypothetical protein